MNAGERKEALIAAGCPVEFVHAEQTPIEWKWTYLPEEAVASAKAKELIASFD